MQDPIQIPDQEMLAEIKRKIDTKTKPTGALGQLEDIAAKIALIQQSLAPKLTSPHILIFAGDHGIASEGVSAYPREVTYQMVYNFLAKGAAINVFAGQNAISLNIIDAGVAHKFEMNNGPIDQKIGFGTYNFLEEAAMSKTEVDRCLKLGAQAVDRVSNESSCNVVGFGEMGIANTSSASMLMSYFCKIPIDQCVGIGTGLSTDQLAHKQIVLQRARDRIGTVDEPLEILQQCGGFEIAQMVGAMIRAAKRKMVLLIDGFIATAAFSVASAIDSNIHHYAIFCHQSGEAGHARMLRFHQADPLIKMNMRLGEGTGCALAFPLIESAIAFFNNMASFESAQVSEKD
ncbi:MAG: nicotinate-nucleotide--dimethylbenzimidazole phosphoribosyltransferase [Cyclobacteriaceae bacterium]